jgi:hydroxymethylbilane synthase
MAMLMAQTAKARLEASYSGLQIDIRTYASTGDTNQGDLKKIGGKGAFVKDLEQRLLSGEIDCAIHALKDVPGDVDMHPELELTCFFEREDPRDALIMREGLAVPSDGAGLTLATSSPRRKAFLHRLYPLATIIPLRGNVDTRMKKLAEGQFDGMVLAYAGLGRLGLQAHATHVYSADEMLPAVGQGVMSLQVRKADAEKCAFLKVVHSTATDHAMAAERRLLRVLEGNCYAAIAGYCTEIAGQRTLRAWVSDPEGKECLITTQQHVASESADALGEAAARDLLSRGARKLIDAEPAAA